MRGAYPRRAAFLGLVLHLLVACASPPQEAIQHYDASFRSVAEVAVTLLDQDAEARLELAKLIREAAAPEAATADFPATFDPGTRLRGRPLTDEGARRTAVQAVVRYNESLVLLAAGSLPGSKAAFEDFAGLASLAATAFPPAAAIAPFVKAIMDEVERGFAVRELTRLLRDGRPVVERILDVLIADTQTYYGNRRLLFAQREAKLRGEFVAAHRSLLALGRTFGPPADQTLAQAIARIDGERAVMWPVFSAGAALPALAWSGPQRFDATAEQLGQAQIARLRERVEGRQAYVQELNRFHDALGRYVGLVEDARAHLGAVEAQLNARPGLTAEVRSAIATGRRLEIEAANLRRSVELLRRN